MEYIAFHRFRVWNCDTNSNTNVANIYDRGLVHGETKVNLDIKINFE